MPFAFVYLVLRNSATKRDSSVMLHRVLVVSKRLQAAAADQNRSIRKRWRRILEQATRATVTGTTCHTECQRQTFDRFHQTWLHDDANCLDDKGDQARTPTHPAC